MSDRLPVPGKPYRIEVTREHIRAGERCDTRACAVALAVREAFPGLEDVQVLVGGAAWGASGGRVWKWRHRSTRWVLAFDAERRVRPTTVTLTPV